MLTNKRQNVLIIYYIEVVTENLSCVVVSVITNSLSKKLEKLVENNISMQLCITILRVSSEHAHHSFSS